MVNEMNLVSWNVNGIRAVLNKGFEESVKELNCDVLCLQETKAQREQVEIDVKDYGFNYEVWNSAEKKGYSGTAIFSKIEPLNVNLGIGIEEHDKEGRVITAEFEGFYLVTVYTPNSKRGLLRLEYRNEWDRDFLAYVKKLEDNKPVVFCGDLNVAHNEIDLKNPQSNKTTATKPGNPGFSDTERENFTKVVESGFVDTFRHLYPTEEKYSWWSYMFQARSKNVGWRIDYFCVSDSLKEKLEDAQIHNEIMGSDHCPVSVKLKFD